MRTILSEIECLGLSDSLYAKKFQTLGEKKKFVGLSTVFFSAKASGILKDIEGT